MSQVLLLILVWLIIMIGLGGLLLVVSHLFTVPVLVLGVRLEKKLLTNLNVRNIFLQRHILSTAADAHLHELTSGKPDLGYAIAWPQ